MGEVLGVMVDVPLNTATRLCVPSVTKCTLTNALPFATPATPRMVVPSLNVTVPSLTVGVTVAVRRTVFPQVKGLILEVRVALEANSTTPCVKTGLWLGRLQESPSYRAVIR